MTLLRIMAGAIVAAIFAIAVVPLLVLMDLNDGGNGWGLCEGGISACRTSYFDGFELLALLAAVLFVLLFALHLTLRAIRALDRTSQNRPAPGPSVPGTPPR